MEDTPSGAAGPECSQLCRVRPAGADPEVSNKSSLEGAVRDAFHKARLYLMKSHELNEDEAISLISVAVDFGVTQVVDGNWGYT